MNSMYVTFPIGKTRSIPFKKWDIVSTGSGTAIVLNVSEIKRDCSAQVFTCVVYPYKRKKTKLGKWLWFKWLKLRIFLNIIKTY